MLQTELVIVYIQPSSSLTMIMFAELLVVFLSLRCASADVSPSTTTTADQRLVVSRNSTVWKDISDVPVKNCSTEWSCENYVYNEMVVNSKGHYELKSCACDPLCLLLEDCCPDVKISSFLVTFGDASKDRVLNGSSPSNGVSAVESKTTTAGDIHLRHGNRVRSTSASFPAATARDISLSSMNTGDKIKNILERYKLYGLTKSEFSCIFDKAINGVNNVSMVTTCPQKYDDPEVAQMCLNNTLDDPLTQQPVSGTATRVLYRNMFCALCHQEPYVAWTPVKECPSPSRPPCKEGSCNEGMNQNHSQCNIYYRPPSDVYQWRPCLGDITSACGPTDNFSLDTSFDKQIAAKCIEGHEQHMVYNAQKSYRNQYCALCNQVALDSISCVPSDFDDRISTGKTQIYGFNAILDINDITGSIVGQRSVLRKVEHNESISCDPGHVFDPFREVCRPVSCPPGRHFIGNTCVWTPETVPDDAQANNISLNCTYIRLNHTEYRLSNDTEPTLELVGANRFYLPTQYSVTSDEVYLCVNYSQNDTRTTHITVEDVVFTFSFAALVASAIGLSVSVIALTFTIFVYGSLRVLRNLPGRNLLSLAVALLLADAMFLVAPSAEEVVPLCALVAAVMHYSYMAYFMWMNVMAFDVFLTFSKTFVKAFDRGKSSKRFAFYSCYAWLTPLALVLPAALLQILEPSSPWNPRYGETLCWISSKNALLLFLAIPLGVLLVMNIFYFLRSVCNIYLARRMSARILGGEAEGRLLTYVKLTVVVGVTWILGFVAALFPSSEVLQYSFIVMNSLQGLFICLCFVCTGKVCRALKRKFHCQPRKFKGSRSISVDTTTTSLTATSRKLSASKTVSHV